MLNLDTAQLKIFILTLERIPIKQHLICLSLPTLSTGTGHSPRNYFERRATTETTYSVTLAPSTDLTSTLSSSKS